MKVFLPPITFAIIMSTGTLACATLSQSDFLPWLALPAQCLNWLNFILFAILAPYALFCWLRNRLAFHSHWDQPASIALFSTSGIALLVLCHQCLFFDLGFYPALLFWIAGAIVSFLLNLVILFKIFLEKHETSQFTPVFFMQVVGLMVLPTSGAALSSDLNMPWSGIIHLVCLLGLGGGLLLYFGLFALILQRHVLEEPISDMLAPTYWIHLAPLGWGGISFVALGNMYENPATQEVIRFFCLLIWGAATWWLIMALLLTIRALCRHGLAFSLTWWGLIFPLGSYALLTKILKIDLWQTISFTVWASMAFIWLIYALRTLYLAYTGIKEGYSKK